MAEPEPTFLSTSILKKHFRRCCHFFPFAPSFLCGGGGALHFPIKTNLYSAIFESDAYFVYSYESKSEGQNYRFKGLYENEILEAYFFLLTFWWHGFYLGFRTDEPMLSFPRLKQMLKDVKSTLKQKKQKMRRTFHQRATINDQPSYRLNHVSHREPGLKLPL